MQGDFSQRIDLSDKLGFFRTLSETLNQTLEYNQRMIDELMQVFSAVANGDLTQTITRDYAGSLEQLKNDVNATVNKLTTVVTAIQQTVDAVNDATEEITKGNINLSQRTEEQAASESMREQAENLRELVKFFKTGTMLETTQTSPRKSSSFVSKHKVKHGVKPVQPYTPNTPTAKMKKTDWEEF